MKLTITLERETFERVCHMAGKWLEEVGPTQRDENAAALDRDMGALDDLNREIILAVVRNTPSKPPNETL